MEFDVFPHGENHVTKDPCRSPGAHIRCHDSLLGLTVNFDGKREMRSGLHVQSSVQGL